MSNVLLDARDLHVYFGASHVLHGVDFHVSEGEAVGLMGRNGMGKTTLLKSLIGLVRPRSGDVRFRGSLVTGVAPWRVARRGVALVPEGRGVFPRLTIAENIDMGAYSRRDREGIAVDRDHVYELFPRLAERRRQTAGTLSGGEQQMLTIGRALLTNPDLLFLDEATEGLAPMIAHEIWRIIRQIRASGIATVIVDKNYAAVSAITDRNVVLVKGRVVLEADRATVRENPAALRRYLGV